MSQSLTTLRNSKVVSIHGRLLGVDRNDHLVGPKSLKKAIEDLTTASTGTDVSNHGVAQVLTTHSTATVQYNLEAPEPGVSKILMMGDSTSTGSHQFLSTPNGASILNTSAGTTVGVVNLVAPGGSVTLMGLTTAQWGVVAIGGYSSTAMGQNVTFTTST